MIKPALKRGRTSDGGPLFGVGGGDGEGEVSEGGKFEQNLGEPEFVRALGRDLRGLGATFFFPTPACPVAESGFSFPFSSPSSPSSSPSPHANGQSPRPGLLPTRTHLLHHQCRLRETDHAAFPIVDISGGW